MRPTNSRNSPPVRRSKSSDSSGTRPIRFLISRPCSGMGIPSSSTDPEVGGISPVSIRMVVDLLKVPFGPRKPKKQPRGTVRFSPSTAALFP